MQYQLSAAAAGTIGDGEAIVFDTTIQQLSPNISYNATTGEFTVTAVGNYFVTWWVATEGAGPSTTVAFSLELNGGSGVIGNSSVPADQVVGTALIPVTTVPSILTLVNTTGEDAFLSATLAQANITILELSI